MIFLPFLRFGSVVLIDAAGRLSQLSTHRALAEALVTRLHVIRITVGGVVSHR